MLVELPPDFALGLNDVAIQEGDTATFSCEVSKKGITVKWFQNGHEINEDERFEVLSEDRVHKLIIKDAILADGGSITAKVEDQKTTAKLTVDGRPF